MADQQSTHFGRRSDVVTYNGVECAVAANIVCMGFLLGEVLFESTHNGMEMLVVEEKLSESNLADDDVVDCWPFELGRQYGREAALEQESHTLTLPNLAQKES